MCIFQLKPQKSKRKQRQMEISEESTMNHQLSRIRVKRISHEAITVPVTPRTKISDIKTYIQQQEGIQVQNQRLIYKANLMNDSQLLREFDIRENGIIHLVTRRQNNNQMEEESNQMNQETPSPLISTNRSQIGAQHMNVIQQMMPGIQNLFENTDGDQIQGIDFDYYIPGVAPINAGSDRNNSEGEGQQPTLSFSFSRNESGEIGLQQRQNTRSGSVSTQRTGYRRSNGPPSEIREMIINIPPPPRVGSNNPAPESIERRSERTQRIIPLILSSLEGPINSLRQRLRADRRRPMVIERQTIQPIQPSEALRLISLNPFTPIQSMNDGIPHRLSNNQTQEANENNRQQIDEEMEEISESLHLNMRSVSSMFRTTHELLSNFNDNSFPMVGRMLTSLDNSTEEDTARDSISAINDYGVFLNSVLDELDASQNSINDSLRIERRLSYTQMINRDRRIDLSTNPPLSRVNISRPLQMALRNDGVSIPRIGRHQIRAGQIDASLLRNIVGPNGDRISQPRSRGSSIYDLETRPERILPKIKYFNGEEAFETSVKSEFRNDLFFLIFGPFSMKQIIERKRNKFFEELGSFIKGRINKSIDRSSIGSIQKYFEKEIFKIADILFLKKNGRSLPSEHEDIEELSKLKSKFYEISVKYSYKMMAWLLEITSQPSINVDF